MKYLSIEKEIENDKNIWIIWKNKERVANFYDLDLCLQTAHYLDEVFLLNDEEITRKNNRDDCVGV